ncbi:hypothetical protein DIZ76_012659 [Coccidioides immitis]|nr:hypothetical protein DIZ76_012659 [Coccidioides immitis]
MAPHFFASAGSPSPLPLPSTMPSRNNNSHSKTLSAYFSPLRPPPIPSQQQQQQPPLPPPPRPSTTPKSVSSTRPSPALQLTPYPGVPQSCPTPHPQVTIDPVKTAHIPSLMRITGLLLPIRYPTSFYSATITDPLVASVSRVAVYHDHPVTGLNLGRNAYAEDAPVPSHAEKVIGGIRCLLEPLGRDTVDGRPATNLYIQTLHLLSPYRGKGVAASLLYSLVYNDSLDVGRPSLSTTSSLPVSALVRHYNIRTVTAHVHETNEEALRWYLARGFKVQGSIVEGYYRRLKPGGARIVKLELNWDGTEESLQNSPSSDVQRSIGGSSNMELEDDDDEWEKVNPSEFSTLERLEDYQQVERDCDFEESPSKRIRNA